ncbi:MAG: helix-turn-helix domain-containing protein [Bryobacteraceae bacterium]
MESFLRVLAGPWTLYLIWLFGNRGPLRFGEIRRLVPGISSKVLTERLRMLEAEGLIYRHYEPTVPPQVTYGPQPRMNQLTPILCQLHQLAADWYPEGDAATGASEATAEGDSSLRPAL